MTRGRRFAGVVEELRRGGVSPGDRLLRIFTNINPDLPRVWVTSDPFEQLAWQYAGKAGLPHPPGSLAKLRSRALRALSTIGMPVVDRPPYDQFMLRFHHYPHQRLRARIPQHHPPVVTQGGFRLGERSRKARVF